MADRLTVYFSSDMHGYVYPTTFADDQTRPMGLLGMDMPKDGNTLVIDGGDTLQGSPLTYYCHTKNLPMPCAGMMNDLGYDYVTLGNHDFNYGYGPLSQHLTALKARCLCANVQDNTSQLPIENFAIHTLANGLRIGLVGIVTPWIKRWEKPENLEAFEIDDPMAAARQAVEALQGKVDLLVGIYHGGFEKDLDTGRLLSATDENIACRLCEALPFDILLTGHQHIAMVNRVYCGTHVVQTPCNAVAYIKLTVDDQGAISSRLCTPRAVVNLKKWEQRLLADLNVWLDQPIGRLSRALLPEDKLSMALHGSSIATLFNLVQLEASGAQVSCTALGNDVRGFACAVTVRDLVASYPYANTLVVLRVTGQVLYDSLEQCASYFAVSAQGQLTVSEGFMLPKQAHYNYDYFAGVEYTFDLRKPVGNRVTRLFYQGKPIDKQELFTLVTSNYRATGAGDFDGYARCEKVREYQTEITELIMNYLAARELVEIPESSPYDVILPNGDRA